MNYKNSINKQFEYKVGEVGQALGLTVRRIQQLVRAGVMPKPETKGRYDLQACTRGYAKNQRRELKALRAVRGVIKKPFKFMPVNKYFQTTEELEKAVSCELKKIVDCLKRPAGKNEGKPKKNTDVVLPDLKLDSMDLSEWLKEKKQGGNHD